MTNTKFRKRALLSSVAMLLVALVALGSATFAWFTTNPNSNTNGIKMTANSSLGLVVQSATERSYCNSNSMVADNYWSHNAVLRTSGYVDGTGFTTNATALMADAASLCYTGDNIGKIYTVQADKSSASAAKANAKIDELTNNTGYYAEDLYLKITGSTTAKPVHINGVSVSLGTGNLKGAVRVAILRGSTVLGIWGPENATANRYILKGSTTGASATEVKYDASDNTIVSASAYTGMKTFGASNDNVSLGANIGTSGTDSIKIVVYLDGMDSTVFTDNIAQADLTKLVEEINVSLTATDA